MKASFLAALFYWLMLPLVWVPRALLLGLSDAMARLWIRLDARESRVCMRNLELAYPELSETERDSLQQSILRTTAYQILESLRFWLRPSARNLMQLKEQHGTELYAAALASGKGVIVIAPHFGNWELLNQWLASRGPISVIYRPPESTVGDAFLRRARGVPNVHQVRAEGPAVRRLWKVLKAGGAVGVLPDQQPKSGDGEFAPFFGVQALTMTLVSRLAERTGAIVLFAWCERRDDGASFALHVEPAPAGIADKGSKTAVTVLNREIERIARRDPSQYQWTYKRYTLRPPGSGEPNPY
ncbi:MAG: lauroyl acyltransferase [Xanthomonadaceae bacterium]|jgi:KDO2-lipid IV(A) lauroyltransferase|nr:lauroyl acyltransferase [Xanthomonadaceae bacterium]